jgi:hypothetical protein
VFLGHEAGDVGANVRLTNAQLFDWMKSIKVLDAELR